MQTYLLTVLAVKEIIRHPEKPDYPTAKGCGRVVIENLSTDMAKDESMQSLIAIVDQQLKTSTGEFESKLNLARQQADKVVHDMKAAEMATEERRMRVSEKYPALKIDEQDDERTPDEYMINDIFNGMGTELIFAGRHAAKITAPSLLLLQAHSKLYDIKKGAAELYREPEKQQLDELYAKLEKQRDDFGKNLSAIGEEVEEIKAIPNSRERMIRFTNLAKRAKTKLKAELTQQGNELLVNISAAEDIITRIKKRREDMLAEGKRQRDEAERIRMAPIIAEREKIEQLFEKKKTLGTALEKNRQQLGRLDQIFQRSGVPFSLNVWGDIAKTIDEISDCEDEVRSIKDPGSLGVKQWEKKVATFRKNTEEIMNRAAKDWKVSLEELQQALDYFSKDFTIDDIRQRNNLPPLQKREPLLFELNAQVSSLQHGGSRFTMGMRGKKSKLEGERLQRFEDEEWHDEVEEMKQDERERLFEEEERERLAEIKAED